MLLPIQRNCNSLLANVAQYMDNRIGLSKIEKYVILIWSITILEWISSWIIADQTGLFYLRVSKNESFDLFRQHTLHLLIKSSLISKVTPGSLTPSPTSFNFF